MAVDGSEDRRDAGKEEGREEGVWKLLDKVRQARSIMNDCKDISLLIHDEADASARSLHE